MLIATLSIPGKLIMGRYVAESIIPDAGRFGHVGLCQLPTKLFCTSHAVSIVSGLTAVI